MSFVVIHKPTFQHQLKALPKERRLQVLEKIEILQEDPTPHAPQKKRLLSYKEPVYRLRSGDFRVFYTYGSDWVTLLGVSDRKDAYRGERIRAEGPGIDLTQLPSDDWDVEQSPHTVANPHSARLDDEFARGIDEELLERLRVPNQHWAALRGCRTFDELADTVVPDAIKSLVLDAVLEPDYAQVLHQPDLITGEASDLLRFAEGELIGFLLRLDPDQERYVAWALAGSGPTLVKGGPGTGKSTIALYRVRSILKLLRTQGIASPRVLFTTYTTALTAASEQLLRRLLGDDADLVDVRTADSVAYSLVAERDGKPTILVDRDLDAPFKEAMRQARLDAPKDKSSLEKLSTDYVLEEINSVIEARALASLSQYLAAPRSGRRVRLSRTQREAIWRVNEAFGRLLKNRGVRTYPFVRKRAAELVVSGDIPPRYEAVVVDEAQDLDATVLRMLVGLTSVHDRFFVTADANQSIYGGGFRWTDVHADLRFQGRTGVLHKNYRTTREIGEAAQDYLQSGALDDEAIERSYAHSDGPLPAFRKARGAAMETDLLVRFLREAAREARQGLGACAVLVPSEAAGHLLAERLTAGGVNAEYMPGRALDLDKSVVKVITLHSAKGLEFPVVAVAGFIDGLPQAGGRGAGEEETEEALARQRRLLFVAMTRAMRSLLVVAPDRPWPLFTGFDPELWNTQSPAGARRQ